MVYSVDSVLVYTGTVSMGGISPMHNVFDRAWRVWAKALGDKSGASNREADLIAIVRSVIIGVNFITCFFIMAGVVHNW